MRVCNPIPVETRLAVSAVAVERRASRPPASSVADGSGGAKPAPNEVEGKHSAAQSVLAAAFRRALLRWYDLNRRDLPWRNTRDPYRIWLSEIMLQQTRVAAVLEYYRVFLERFPSVEALAAASEDAVLAAWSGLGYYRRARMLRRCAQEIIREHGGRFPRSAEALGTLPGIGRYTAAAIASIAFDESVAVVDGNVARIAQRLVGHNLAQPDIWRKVQWLLAASRPGDFNQAMMELGATVCLPRGPKCSLCPIRKWCETQGEIPPKAAPRQAKEEIWCALDQRNGRVRLMRRPKESALMPGMWELPPLSQDSRPRPLPPPWRTFRHSITTTDFTVHVFRAAAPVPGSNWVAIQRIPHLPLTGLTRKILKAAGII